MLWQKIEPPRAGILLDVGGGAGRYALEALRRSPGLRAIVADLPESEPSFRRLTAGQPEASRLGFAAADAIEGPLPRGDAALVSSLVHIYGPDTLARLARNLAAALSPGGTLLIRDFFFDDETHTSPPSTALFAINMLVNTDDGGCYTPAELEEIFGAAGFTNWRLVPLDERSAVLAGTRQES
ncbi:MAG TPA: methyltransferase domain-containing protein [Acidobacteria bacterium]|nr:methyltransferase domain-containing protein [Acidobacteriota bacterium]